MHALGCVRLSFARIVPPAIQIRIPREVPPDPSYTDSMTPLVSTTSPTVSAFVGTWRSMTTASSAVMTGIADLHAIMAPFDHAFPNLRVGTVQGRLQAA